MDSTELFELMNKLEGLCSLNSTDCLEYSKILKGLTEWTKLDRKRIICRRTLSVYHWKTLLNLAEYGVHLATRGSPLTDDELDFLANLLRCTRNFVAGIYDEQSLSCFNDVLQFALKILVPLLKQRANGNDKETVVLRCCLQVFGNLVCQNSALKSIVWNAFRQGNLFRVVLLDSDLKVQEYSTMILYNCLTPEYLEYIVSTEEGHEIIIALTDAMYLNIVDWGILIMESIISHRDFMEKCYSALPTKSRLLFLDVMVERLENSQQNECVLPDSNLQHAKDFFKEYVMDILKTSESSVGDLKSSEIVKLLSVMCSASVVSKCSSVLKSYQDLLELALDTLKSVHLLGKHSCNAFSALSSLKELGSMSREEVEDHPSFGFKKNLIRLIGNMCSNCKENQDLVRQLDGIPLLLDCCNVDARNPYIMQWGILAVYNVVENNLDNQSVLANISVSGDLANSALLKELGLQVEIQNGHPVLKRC